MRGYNRAIRFFGVALCATCAWQSAVAANMPAPRYVPTRNTTDPQFFTAIERIGKCEIKGEPLASGSLRVPAELYPPDSVRNHEEGTVRLKLIFDPDWCVRKVSVVKSTGFWRLDAVSLEFAINLKWKPSKTLMIDGEPTVEIPIGWGASQGKHDAM